MSEEDKKMRKSTAILIIVGIWVWWSGLMMLNVFLEEALGRHMLTETTETTNNYYMNMQLFNWLGGLGWVLCGLLLTSVPTCILCKQPYALCFSAFCSLDLFLTMGIMGFVEPNTSWRQLELAESSLASGGEMLTGCFIATNPHKLQIHANITYYTLIDKEWHVDWESRRTFSQYGWVWISTPIVYDGPVAGCKFNPPIYAACIAQSGNANPKGCWFKTTGPYVTIRKLSQSEYMEQYTMSLIPYSGPSRSDYMMEWDSQTLRDTREYVNWMHNKADDQWRNIGMAWGLVTGAAAVAAVVMTVTSERFGSK